jgi:hypothetical protein
LDGFILITGESWNLSKRTKKIELSNSLTRKSDNRKAKSGTMQLDCMISSTFQQASEDLVGAHISICEK